jgi:hypothetical protein
MSPRDVIGSKPDANVLEAIARISHESYVVLEAERGADDTTVGAFDSLPESLKASSRSFAQRVYSRLAQLGYDVVVARAYDSWLAATVLSDEQIEALAEQEHCEWMQARARERWRTRSRGATLRHHPTLVPWKELPAAERDKDRAWVRRLLRAMDSAGLRLVRK